MLPILYAMHYHILWTTPQSSKTVKEFRSYGGFRKQINTHSYIHEPWKQYSFIGAVLYTMLKLQGCAKNAVAVRCVIRFIHTTCKHCNNLLLNEAMLLGVWRKTRHVISACKGLGPVRVFPVFLKFKLPKGEFFKIRELCRNRASRLRRYAENRSDKTTPSLGSPRFHYGKYYQIVVALALLLLSVPVTDLFLKDNETDEWWHTKKKNPRWHNPPWIILMLLI